jgi:hypothetical protein
MTGRVQAAWESAVVEIDEWVGDQQKDIVPGAFDDFHATWVAVKDQIETNGNYGASAKVFRDQILGPQLGKTIGKHLVASRWQSNMFFQDRLGKLAAIATEAFDERTIGDATKGKRIEYVPHFTNQPDSLKGGAPTNQRGRLTLVGYTPAEAVEKLKELGVVHDLEPEVPFKSIMRSNRRYGNVLPMHSDYVSGEFELPTVAAAISHGITTGMWGVGTGGDNRLLQVIRSGGLLSTSERYRQGISVNTTTPAGDIRSGVDHVLFGCMGKSHYGDVKVVYKDSAYLRRDVLLTNRDFGPQVTRYPSYRKYHNSIRKDASAKGYEESINTNPYEPLSPRARQAHINSITNKNSVGSLSASNNEWNIGPSVPVEDWAHVLVPNVAAKTETDELFDRLMREGRIAERPEVLVDGSNSGIAYEKAFKRLPSGQTSFTPPPLPTRKSENGATTV